MGGTLSHSFKLTCISLEHWLHLYTVQYTRGMYVLYRALVLFFFFVLLGCVRGLPNEGMPMFRHNEIRGNLYIRIDVEFPEDQFLSADDLQVRYSTNEAYS